MTRSAQATSWDGGGRGGLTEDASKSLHMKLTAQVPGNSTDTASAKGALRIIATDLTTLLGKEKTVAAGCKLKERTHTRMDTLQFMCVVKDPVKGT